MMCLFTWHHTMVTETLQTLLVIPTGFKNKTLAWRLQWPQYIIESLVTSPIPNGTISNSDLDLVKGFLYT